MKNVAILTGGYSGEAVIAEKSAKMVLQSIDRSKYNCALYRITKEKWEAEKDGEDAVLIDRSDFSASFSGGKFIPEVAFIMIHGTPGEDGIIQGYLEMLNIPYTTGDVLNMALTFSKNATTSYLRNLNIPVANGFFLHGNAPVEIDTILDKVGLPCFVKPNEGGSSLGMSKVETKEELAAAITKARAVFPEVLIESFMEGREVTCGVIPRGDSLLALPPTEIITGNSFFDYEAKYEGQSQEITPADIPAEWTERIQFLAKEIYRAMRCKGFVRIDFMVVDNEPHVIEVNTVPGFSGASIVPQQLEAAGISAMEMISAVIDLSPTSE